MIEILTETITKAQFSAITNTLGQTVWALLVILFFVRPMICRFDRSKELSWSAFFRGFSKLVLIVVVMIGFQLALYYGTGSLAELVFEDSQQLHPVPSEDATGNTEDSEARGKTGNLLVGFVWVASMCLVAATTIYFVLIPLFKRAFEPSKLAALTAEKAANTQQESSHS